MFGLGFTEILFISMIGLLVIGPEKLPTFIKKFAEVITKFRRMWNQVQYEVGQEVATLVDKKETTSMKNKMKDLQNIAHSSQFSLENILGKETKNGLVQTIDSVKQHVYKKEKAIKKLTNPKNK